jgi:sigma-B regulation protein RsbU (phosphoserine phosphatase)
VIPRNFYDFIMLDRQRLFVAIGDLAGDGPGAALMAASTLRTLRQLCEQRGDLIDIIAGLNDEIRIDLFHGCSVSLFAAVINLPFNTMACLNVGFPPAILLNPQREITLQQINTDGEVLGRMNGQQFRNTLRPTSIQLESGDIVMLYTDGVARCANPKDLNAGRLAIMGSCISNLKHPCLLMINQVLEQTKQIQPGRIADDLTVLAIRVKESV